ncbi:unnamed protein product [Rotaria magnacalcarata]|uniref:Uncharacterized protein n=2 Tax=Rotaria magnacalcarata TaxID=392030 RepID=A0A816X4N0_9BILA|nr:unnamed protein product [Rotaria magnacalcarata]
MQHRLEKVRNEVKNELIDGKKGISGLNRLTQCAAALSVHMLSIVTCIFLLDMIINFKYYYRQAIVRNKTNLDDMVKVVWAIYKHKSSTNSDPYQEWCSPAYCGFWKALAKDENLSRVLNGSTQNPNESYHSVLWSMAPKSRSSSGAIIDFCVALSVIVYNDGFQSLLSLFESLLGSSGTFTSSIFQRLDQQPVLRLVQSQSRQETR